MTKHVRFALMVGILLLALQRAKGDTYFGHESGDNIFGNPEFDEEISKYSEDSWHAVNEEDMAYGITSEGCFSGCSCAFAANRTRREAALRSRVPIGSLKADTHYWVSLFIKVTKDTGSLFNITLRQRVKYKNDTDKFSGLMHLKFLREEDRWLYMASHVSTPDPVLMEALDWIEFFPEPPANVDFMLDATSLTEIKYSEHWRDTAQANIETHRKANLNVRIVTPSCMDPSLVKLEINQTKNAYPFGCMTRDDMLTDHGLGDSEEDNLTREENAKYRAYFTSHFDWTTFAYAFKWPAMEGNAPVEDDSKFERVDKALDWLEAEGKYLQTRGHCLHWNSMKFEPDYVADITDSEDLVDEYYRRIDYMTQHYKGRIEQYDVSNEHSSGYDMETRTGNRDILRDLHNRTRQGDNAAKLFLNNYAIIGQSHQLARLVNDVDYLKHFDLVDGVGIQGHFKNDSIMDIEVIKRRLDVFRGLDIPIWITEFDSVHWDLEAKPAFFEDMLTLLYGTSEVEGVVIWGMEHVVDENYQNSPVGEVVERLIHSDWRTTLEVTPDEPDFTGTYRAFHGTYEIMTTYNGTTIAQRTLELTDDKDIDLEFVCFCDN